MGHTRLISLLVRWEEELDGGAELTPEQLCTHEPGLVEPLREAIAANRRIRRLFASSLDPKAAVPPSAASPETLALSPGASDRSDMPPPVAAAATGAAAWASSIRPGR